MRITIILIVLAYILSSCDNLMQNTSIPLDKSGNHVSPVWSPLDNKLLVTQLIDDSTSSIWLLDVDTHNSNLLVPDNNKLNHAPTWLSDGSQIAYMVTNEGNTEIRLILTDGTNSKVISQFSSGRQSVPRWSPNGQYLSVLSIEMVQSVSSNLWILDSNGENPRNLTLNSDLLVNFYSWAGDSQEIVISFANLTESSLEIINVNTGNVTQIYTGGSVQIPDWSPISNTIAFGVMLETNSDIMSISSDGANLVNLTDTPDIYEANPVWSPNGEYIAYRTFTNPIEGNLNIMTANGLEQHNLTSNLPCNVNFYSWSPDSERLAFDCIGESGSDIWIINRDGSNAINLTGG